MKKFLILLLSFLIVLVSCSKPENKYDTEDVSYSIMQALYAPFNTAQEVVDSAKIVFIGKVTNINFKMLDSITAQAPTEKSEERHIMLHTIYDFDIITLYKGEEIKTIQVKFDGGIKDYRVEDQLAVLGENSEQLIPIWEGQPEMRIGETYLMAVKQKDDRPAFNMIPQQSIYNLKNPFEKHTVGSYELEFDDPVKYYSEKNDQYGRPIMSAKDIISTFGENQWNDFWVQWQKDNSNWATWIDKASVEKILNEN